MIICMRTTISASSLLPYNVRMIQIYARFMLRVCWMMASARTSSAVRTCYRSTSARNREFVVIHCPDYCVVMFVSAVLAIPASRKYRYTFRIQLILAGMKYVHSEELKCHRRSRLCEIYKPPSLTYTYLSGNAAVNSSVAETLAINSL